MTFREQLPLSQTPKQRAQLNGVSTVRFSFGFLVLFIALLTGCGESNRAKKLAARSKEASTEEFVSMPPEIVESTFRSLSIGRNPSDHKESVGQLNAYLQSLGGRRPTVDAKVLEANKAHQFFTEALLSGAEFSSRDLDYASEVLFLSESGSSIKAGDDLAGVREVFGWVVRHVQLAEPQSVPPAGPALTLLRGRGTPNERAWVFVEMLRRFGFKSAVVEGLSADSSELFVGVWTGTEKGRLWLFGVSRGAPIPNASGQQVATLQEVESQPALLEKIGIQPAKPLSPRLLLPWESATASARFAAVQAAVPGSQKIALHDDLSAWLENAQKVGKPIGVWTYPEETRSQLQTIEQKQRTYAAINPYWMISANNPFHLLTQGNISKAAPKFINFDFEKSPEKLELDLRSSGLPIEMRSRIAARTRQDVVYFGGLAQLEKAEPGYEVADKWFDRYLTQFGTPVFSPESILDPGRLCMRLVQEGNGKTQTVGKLIWEGAQANAGQKAIEGCARDFGKSSSITEQKLKRLDDGLNTLLQAVEERSANPQKESDARAQKVDPRDERIEQLISEVRSAAADLPSIAPEKALNRYMQEVAKRANDSLIQTDAAKEQATVLRVVAKDVSDTINAESQRAFGARRSILEVLTRMQQDAEFPKNPAVKSLAASLPPEVRSRLESTKSMAEERLAANGKVIAIALGPELLLEPQSETFWSSGAVRLGALASHRRGKTAEAVKRLEAGHPTIGATARKELSTWAALLKAYPQWRWD